MKDLILDIIKDHNYCYEVDLLKFLNPINPEVFAFRNLYAFTVNDTSHLPIFCRWCYKTDLGYINLLQVEGRFYVLDSLIYSDLNNI